MRISIYIIMLSFIIILCGCANQKEYTVDLNDDICESENMIVGDDIEYEQIEESTNAEKSNDNVIETAYVDTIRCGLGDGMLLRNHLLLISTEEELEYAEQNMGVNQILSRYNSQSGSNAYEIMKDNFPLSEYNYIICYSKYWDSHFYHHSDAVEYDANSEHIYFHYDIIVTPPASRHSDNTIVAYMDMAAIRKDFFDGKKINNLYTPEEMETQRDEALNSIN